MHAGFAPGHRGGRRERRSAPGRRGRGARAEDGRHARRGGEPRSPEALLVLDGQLQLEISGQPVPVGAGELYMIPAGTSHAVRPGSRGTLVIVELREDAPSA
ncbi:cupin domain-containing protein [Streptomyces melanogenes]|uniref:cupin domain-containing protein n=1 Tax=Streptomyces melanogenes TaxID=67326 RepID=UPI00379A1790